MVVAVQAQYFGDMLWCYSLVVKSVVAAGSYAFFEGKWKGWTMVGGRDLCCSHKRSRFEGNRGGL